MSRLMIAAAMLGAFSLAVECQAQSLFGNNQGQGGRQQGGGMGGGRQGGQTGAAGRNAGQAGAAAAGAMNQGGGARNGGQGRQNGAMAPQFNPGDGTLGAQIGQRQFIGGNDGNFIGNRLSGQNGGANVATPQFGNMQQGLRQGQPGAGNQFRGAARQNQRRLRPQVQVGFQTAGQTPPPASQSLMDRIVALPAFSGTPPEIALRVDDQGTALLTGTVATEHERRLMETIIRFEPGVRNVEHQLAVSAETPTP